MYDKYEGTRTLECLQEAFRKESEARNKYTFFASKARKEGFVQIAELFEKTAGNEKEHAEIWYKEMCGIGTTADNLLIAANEEYKEWSEIYEKYASIALAEGFEDLAVKFREVGKIERTHERIYRQYLRNVVMGSVFKRVDEVTWKCSNCGHIVVAKEAPLQCSVCEHPQGYFSVLSCG